MKTLIIRTDRLGDFYQTIPYINCLTRIYGKTNVDIVVKAIAFNSIGTVLESYLVKNNKNSMNIAGTLISNNWNGKNNIEFVINDISVNNI